MHNNATNDKSEGLSNRRVPCLAAYLHPFRIINGPESREWDLSIEQVNFGTWDIAALHEIVGGIDVGLEAPYHLVVCRDGGLALPPIPELRDEVKAVEFFNRCLASLLIGGIYCEAIALDGLDFGSILDWKYVRISSQATAAPNRFHNLLRLQRASPLEAIALMEPRALTLTELINASKAGRSILERLPEVGGEFLLRGSTGFARRDWGVALANLWIVVEQMTSHLWEHSVISDAKKSPSIVGRIDSLMDNRTWTVGARHEVLFQKGILSPFSFTEISKARKARNRLAHSGVHPDEASARSALHSVKQLMQVSVPDLEIPFLTLDLDDHGISDPFQPKERGPIDPRYWMEIKKLPGEVELEKLEAQARKRVEIRSPEPPPIE